ncbi:hypothetical protein AW67_5220 [Salmonella enterica subsp. enterica serovar Montevideo str. USDA-ARS-USMARC-1903]|uniref:Uncharacterized protein n=1 Tax=Salmonella enterica subsp. enterica serovar Rubislaw str. A4-653 TaxID=913081 RepID=G5QTG1_SALRU|nr:hypothetical protein AW67_5220 [Salmonella enterica subsp. enterica serovar Montevideo str. USDA-ARS-USMARC-1903]EHC28174.1 hypothetical protein SeGA_6032 [Salmonella enterica subsp. enterica serovar Gaminara str. A4-567]EHC42524.1 hypothetical protein LTSEGIV_5735 [Salmonella enterica subsp. enterica serovar Give str. S5-487]EHC77031.1 hypothetical protein LTSERUB_6557 [Salmonella enterica subsp. enterica serovar Rubislaw str. A4-653]
MSRFCILFSRGVTLMVIGDKKSNFTQAKGNGQSLVYRWFNYVTV